MNHKRNTAAPGLVRSRAYGDLELSVSKIGRRASERDELQRAKVPGRRKKTGARVHFLSHPLIIATELFEGKATSFFTKL